MQTNISTEAFNKWLSWKEHSVKMPVYPGGPRRLSETVTSVCMSLGLRPEIDYHVTANEVRFSTKTFLAMFKLNWSNHG
jgi:hypothetical protein|tara:strand:+ start:1093 stop:1329 length:237 start_codon:yes stop_codon:yes gene_type:complete